MFWIYLRETGRPITLAPLHGGPGPIRTNHAGFVMDEVTLTQVFQFFNNNHNPTIALYSSVTVTRDVRQPWPGGTLPQNFFPDPECWWSQSTVRQKAAPLLRRLVAGLPPRRPRFELGSGHVGFLIDEVALGQVFSSTSVSTANHHSTSCSTITIIYQPGLVQ
jgi:hypothetical protein